MAGSQLICVMHSAGMMLLIFFPSTSSGNCMESEKLLKCLLIVWCSICKLAIGLTTSFHICWMLAFVWTDYLKAPCWQEDCKVPEEHHQEGFSAWNHYQEGEWLPRGTCSPWLLHLCCHRIMYAFQPSLNLLPVLLLYVTLGCTFVCPFP